MLRSIFLIAASLVALAVCSPLSAAERPNVLFIMADDLGMGDLSSHGAKDMRTPHIDALMASGCRFENAYANCPVCSPTRASFLSGRYPDMVGVPGVIRTHRENNWGYLDPEATLLPEVMKGGGYDTAIIGKWHLGLVEPNTPLGRGFDFFKGYLGDMMDDYYDHRRHGVNYMRQGRKEIDPEGHATELFSQWAIDYFAERKGADSPFFLFLSYNAPHTPIQPPEDWIAKVKTREQGITDKRAKIVALIEHLDEGVGKVLAALDANGQRENTMVVFSSDNGGQANVGARNVPWRGEKQEMWEGGLRVPTCVSWPGKIEAGARHTGIAMTMDWLPTFAELGGVAAPEEIEGQSLLGALTRGEAGPPADRTLVWVRREGGAKYGGRVYYAIRRGPWKLLQNTPYERPWLVNLARDPGEKGDAGERKERKELDAALREHIRRAGGVRWQGRDPDLENVE